MIGYIFQWKPGTEYDGQNEIISEDLGFEWKFESGNTVPKSELHQKLNTIGMSPKAQEIPKDHIPDWMNNPYASAENAASNTPAIIEEKPSLIDQLLDRQKKWDHLPVKIEVNLNILTKKAYELASMMFDENEISEAIIKRTKKEIEAIVKQTIEETITNLPKTLNIYYGIESE